MTRIAVYLVAIVVAVGLVVAWPAFASPPTLPAPTGLPHAIEPLAAYVGQVSCDQQTPSGTRRLADLLDTTYGTTSATTYACGTDGHQSEHYDRRALDWMVSIHDATQRADATAFLTWLLGSDAAGNRFAMARRLGVMYVIWNNRMWGSWSGQWEPYNGCAALPARTNDNACHRTHMHISLGWNGATGHTSFWTKRIYATDYGPCRQAGLNWAYLYTHSNTAGCPNAARPTAATKASPLKRSLITWSGAAVRRGWTGPAVTAVQQALHVAPTGHFGAATAQAVRTFQQAHPGCRISGAMNIKTWQALLAAVR